MEEIRVCCRFLNLLIRWFDEWQDLQFQFPSLLLFRIKNYIPKSAHKEYWDEGMLIAHIWQIENNLGDRGKFRVIKGKHKCKRYMRAFRGYIHT